MYSNIKIFHKYFLKKFFKIFIKGKKISSKIIVKFIIYKKFPYYNNDYKKKT